jgi:nitrilase
MSGPVLKVAITQAEPEYLDLARGVEKTVKLITEAAQGGANLVAFPECWITGYPGWIW